LPKLPIRVPRTAVRVALALVIALLTAAGVIQITDPPAPTPAPTRAPSPTMTITVELGGPGHATVPASAPTPAPADAEADLNAGPTPAPAIAEHNDTLKPAGQPTVPAALPLAAPTVPGCKTALVRNFSSRNGAPVLLGVIHWTGSAITPGWAGIDGNLKWFDTPAAQASSNYITDSWGNCALAVPEALKAWTQAGFNPWSVSVEIVNPGVLPLFRSQAGFDRVVELLVGWHDRWNLPLRRAHVSGCKVLLSGILAHRDLGACGGGHPDVGTGDDVDRLIAAAKKIVAARTAASALDRSTCRKLNWWRAHGRPHGLAETRAVRRRRALAVRGVTCTAHGPVKRQR
jgi:hypothetical protein